MKGYFISSKEWINNQKVDLADGTLAFPSITCAILFLMSHPFARYNGGGEHSFVYEIEFESKHILDSDWGYYRMSEFNIVRRIKADEIKHPLYRLAFGIYEGTITEIEPEQLTPILTCDFFNEVDGEIINLKRKKQIPSFIRAQILGLVDSVQNLLPVESFKVVLDFLNTNADRFQLKSKHWFVPLHNAIHSKDIERTALVLSSLDEAWKVVRLLLEDREELSDECLKVISRYVDSTHMCLIAFKAGIPIRRIVDLYPDQPVDSFEIDQEVEADWISRQTYRSIVDATNGGTKEFYIQMQKLGFKFDHAPNILMAIICANQDTPENILTPRTSEVIASIWGTLVTNDLYQITTMAVFLDNAGFTVNNLPAKNIGLLSNVLARKDLATIRMFLYLLDLSTLCEKDEGLAPLLDRVIQEDDVDTMKMMLNAANGRYNIFLKHHVGMIKEAVQKYKPFWISAMLTRIDETIVPEPTASQVFDKILLGESADERPANEL